MIQMVAGIPFKLEGMENTPVALEAQSMLLYQSYLLAHNLEDIQQAVLYAQQAFDLMPPESPDPMVLYNLARSSLRLFQQTKQIDYVTKAIKMFRQLLTDNNPVRQKSLNYLGISYFERDGNLNDFRKVMRTLDLHDQSILSIETLTNNLDEDDEVFELCLHALSYYEPRIRSCHSHTSLEDLASAIQLSRQALEFCCNSSNPAKIARERSSCSQPKISIILSKLGIFLTERFIQQSNLQDIDEAVYYCCRCVKLMLPSSPLFGNCLIQASKALTLRFEWQRLGKDLEEAVYLAQVAINVVKLQGWNSSAKGLDNLAKVMMRRFQATNDLNDLDVAIKASSRAVDIIERHKSDAAEASSHNERMINIHFGECNQINDEVYGTTLNNLAVCLRLRSQRTGRAEDLKEAIEARQKAVNLMPPNDRKLVPCLVNLSSDEYLQAAKLLDVEYVKRAEQHIQQAWNIRGKNFGLESQFELHLINTSAEGLLTHYEFFPDMKWLDRATATARIGTSPVYTHHPWAGHSRRILCACLIKKWQIAHKQKDFDKAISTIDEAIDVASCAVELDESKTDQSVLAQRILGDCLYCRYKSTRVHKDLEKAVNVLQKGLRMSTGGPYYRILAGQLAIDILSEHGQWESAHNLSREILNLLVILHGRSLDWQDKQFWLRHFSDRAATYASIALEAGKGRDVTKTVLDAIDMLETCRGTILGHVIDSRTDLAELTKVSGEKAERFKALQNEINNMIDLSENTITRVEQITRRGKAGEEIHACIEDIRRLEGFDRFLLGLTPREFKIAAAQGPIIIVNVTLIRSDAIIVTKNDYKLLPLPGLKYEIVAEYVEADLTNFSGTEDKRNKNKIYLKLQKWLWDNCVKLIFDKLGDLMSSSAKFHVWWIGIGIASSLPFHAAGNYTDNLKETALFQAISSYTPTLKVLMHSRRKPKDDSPDPNVQHSAGKPRLKIIVMPTTPRPGFEDLDKVQEEAEAIQKAVQGAYRPDETMIVRWPSAKDTMAHMEECEIVHFACHGKSILTDPSSSHILLQAPTGDSAEELKVRDVAAANLRRGKLAFLSACSTAQSELEQLRDETLHLASGFQIAGYLNAIGNLWQSDDEISVQVAKGFYDSLVALGELGDGQNVAEALNNTLKVVARKFPKRPLAWAQFVHFGI